MPIVDVEMVEDEQGGTRVSATALADALGEILGSQPGGCWVRVRRLARSDYAENGVEVSRDLRPVWVSIMRGIDPAERLLVDEAAQIARSVARICGRARENVHVIYLPQASGRIAFGGVIESERAED